MQNQIYQDNLKALEEFRPQLYKQVIDSQNSLNLEVVASCSGQFTLKVNNIFFHSAYNPQDETRYLIEDIDFKNIEGAVILGFGLGYHAKKIWGNPYFNGKLLIVEKEIEIFKKALEAVDLISLIKDRSVIFLVGVDSVGVATAIENMGFFTINMIDVQIVLHPPSLQVFLAYYLDILKDLRRMLSLYRCTFDTMRLFQHTWYQRSVENVVDVALFPGINEVKGIYSNLPGIVVSAGPSLNSAIEQIRKAKGKVPIYAVGTAYKVLVDHDILPDFVVVVDADDAVLKQFEGVDNYQSYLFAGDFIPQKIINRFKPRLIFFSCPGNPFSILLPEKTRDKGNMFAGGSVSHVAVDIAVNMGCNPIILIGQDLCYDGDKTYADGTMWDHDRVVYSSEDDFRRKGYMWVKGNYQEKVISYPAFFTFLGSFERYVRRHPEIKFINANCKGAFIEGMKLMTVLQAMQEYVENLPSRDIVSLVKKTSQDFCPDKNELKNNLIVSVVEFKKIIKDLKVGYLKAKELKKFIISKKEIDRKKIHDVAVSLDQISAKIDKNAYMKIIEFGSGGYRFMTLDTELKTIKIKTQAQRKMAETANEIYKEFLDTSEYILKIINGFLKDKELWKKTNITN